MEKILIVYSSIDGHTRTICQFINDILKSKGTPAEIFSVQDFDKKIEDYDKILIASSIRYGKHNPLIETLIEENAAILTQKKAVFVSVNLVARKPEKNTAETNPYVAKFLQKIKWKPTMVEVFAGRLDYKLYKLSDRLLIKFIMLITKGPTHSKTPIEYTNWSKVTDFAERFFKL